MIKNSSPRLPNVKSGSREPSIVIPSDILELLGPAPLIGTEDPSRYRDLMCRFAVEFDPKTITEWLLVSDLVNVNWEILRYRRARTTVIRLACPDVASELVGQSTMRFDDFSNEQFRSQTVSGLVVSDKSRSKGPADEVRRKLAAYGLTLEDVYDAALIEKIDDVERFDKMIETMENRRKKLFGEFHAHRSLNPETAKQKTITIVDQFGSEAA